MWQLPFDVLPLSLSSEARRHLPSFFLLSGGIRALLSGWQPGLLPQRVKKPLVLSYAAEERLTHANDVGIQATFQRGLNVKIMKVTHMHAVNVIEWNDILLRWI